MELQTIWSWQPALYLFLGGMGAGAFVMAAVLFLIDRTRHRLIVCVSMWAALASLAVGLLLLLSELVTPLRGLMMWQSFGHFTSWMTYGAWGAFAAMAVFAVSALLATRPVGVWLAKKWKWFEKRGVALRRVLAVIGIVLGAFVAVYTGMLLMAAGSVPLWSTPLLPALFTVSAFDTGVALVELVGIGLGTLFSPALGTLLGTVAAGAFSLWLNPYMNGTEANFSDWVTHGSLSYRENNGPGGYQSPYGNNTPEL